MADNEEKRIVVRVDPETWQRWDDKRHSERTSFQLLGVEFFSRWFEPVPESVVQDPKPVPLVEQESPTGVAPDTLSAEERDLRHAVVALVRSKETGIAEAVKALLRPYVGVQFDDKKEAAGNRDPGDGSKRSGKAKRVA